MKSKKYVQLNLNLFLIYFFYFMSTFITVLFLILIKEMEFKEWSKFFLLIMIFQIIFQYIHFKILKIGLINLMGFFLIFSYFFHFGQIFVLVCFPNYEFSTFNFLTYYNSIDVKKSLEYALIVIAMVGFGVIISEGKGRLSIKNKKVRTIPNQKLSRKLGWIIVFFTFPIQFYLDFTKLLISIAQGYLATYEVASSGLLSAIGFISFTGFSLLILGYSDQKKKALIIFCFIIIYLVLSMFTGHRGHQITVIIFIVYIFHKALVPIKGKILIPTIVLLFFGLAILNTIADFRITEGRNITSFFTVFFENLQGNTFKDIIVELGGTINTLILVMQQVPDLTSHTYGLTYITSVFSTLPNVGNLFYNINSFSLFTNSIKGSALGGSFIGELYYNFSYFGILFTIFIGIFISKISMKIDYLLRYKLYFELAFFAPLFMYILWWPRDTFYSLLRPFTWGSIVLIVLASLVINRNKNLILKNINKDE